MANSTAHPAIEARSCQNRVGHNALNTQFLYVGVRGLKVCLDGGGGIGDWGMVVWEGGRKGDRGGYGDWRWWLEMGQGEGI